MAKYRVVIPAEIAVTVDAPEIPVGPFELTAEQEAFVIDAAKTRLSNPQSNGKGFRVRALGDVDGRVYPIFGSAQAETDMVSPEVVDVWS